MWGHLEVAEARRQLGRAVGEAGLVRVRVRRVRVRVRARARGGARVRVRARVGVGVRVGVRGREPARWRRAPPCMRARTGVTPSRSCT